MAQKIFRLRSLKRFCVRSDVLVMKSKLNFFRPEVCFRFPNRELEWLNVKKVSGRQAISISRNHMQIFSLVCFETGHQSHYYSVVYYNYAKVCTHISLFCFFFVAADNFSRLESIEFVQIKFTETVAGVWGMQMHRKPCEVGNCAEKSCIVF